MAGKRPNLSAKSVRRKRRKASLSWGARKEFARRNGLSFPNGGLIRLPK
jgi:hypothetical protein